MAISYYIGNEWNFGLEMDYELDFDLIEMDH